MGLLYNGLSVWVQSRLDPCPNDTYIHTYIYLNIEEHQKIRKFRKMASETTHPIICLLFASDDVIPGKQTVQTAKC